ncbi:ribosomal 40S subunit protein S10A [Orobanche gracilis]
MILAKFVASRRSISTLPFLSQRIEQTGLVKVGMADEVQASPKAIKGSGGRTEIRIMIKSFDNQLVGLPAHAKKVAMPDTRSLFTVNRSPHVDKKSREQFHMKVKKQLLIMDADRDELSKKYFWLKRQRIIGAQFEIVFSCETRLDKGKLQKLLAAVPTQLLSKAA